MDKLAHFLITSAFSTWLALFGVLHRRWPRWTLLLCLIPGICKELRDLWVHPNWTKPHAEVTWLFQESGLDMLSNVAGMLFGFWLVTRIFKA